MKIELSCAELEVIQAPIKAMADEVVRMNVEVARLQERLASGGTVASTDGFRGSEALLRLLTRVCSHLASNEKINAIKVVREVTGCGLKEAKDVVEGNYASTKVISRY